MKPSTLQTVKPPSIQLRKAVFVGSLRLLLFASTVMSGAEKDQAVTKSPVWRCLTGSETHVIWRANTGWQSGPVVVGDGKILVGAALSKGEGGVAEDCGAMICFDADGKLLWRATHPRLGRRIHDMGQPIQSKPCIDGKRAYYVSNRGELMCVDMEGFRDTRNDGPFLAEVETGPTNVDVLWKIDMMANLGVYKREAGDVGNPLSSPIVIGDLVFCVTGHGRSGAHELPYGVMSKANGLQSRRATPEPPSFLAVKKLTGKVAWSSNAPGTNILHSQWSSPVHARVNQSDQVIFPGGDGWLYGFEAISGKLIWKFDCNDGAAKDWFRDDVRWDDISEAKNFFVASPVVYNNVLYVGLNKDFEFPSVGPLLAINLKGREGRPALKWKFNAPEFVGTYTSATVVDGMVFITAGSGILFALDADTGRELWQSNLDDGRNMYTSPVVDNGKVYAGAESTVVVFAAAREKKCFGRFELCCSPSTPLIAGGRLYVAAGESLWALRLPDSR